MPDCDDAIDALVGGFAQLNVQEQLRPSNDVVSQLIAQSLQ